MATKSNTLTFVDIIGSPSNYPQAWKDAMATGTRLYGVPLVMAEDGTSMLPTGALTTFKLSRKANAAPLQVLKSTDSGVTWTALTVTTHYTFSTTTNAITFTAGNIPLTTDLIMVIYQTHTNMVVAGVNAEVLEIGDVLATMADDKNYGGFLLNNLIGKIPTNPGNTPEYGIFGKPNGHAILNDSKLFGASGYPNHVTIPFASSTSPAAKFFPYLTRSNGKARLQLVFKEMKYSTVNADWGDDSTFNIVDNVSTTTDWYGSTVLIGQKYVELPYFISAGE